MVKLLVSEKTPSRKCKGNSQDEGKYLQTICNRYKSLIHIKDNPIIKSNSIKMGKGFEPFSQISPKNIHKWPIITEKDAQYY